MWCPSCGVEYRPGFSHCPDCDVDLVAEPPPEPEAPERGRRLPPMSEIDRLGPGPAEVYVGPPPEADLMRAVLEGSGIACFVWRSGEESTFGGMLPNRVMVRADEANRASEIIAAARTGALDLDQPMVEDETDVESDEPDGHWIQASDLAVSPSRSGPVREVVPWWKHPELPALVSAARVVLVLGAIVGLVYLIFVAVAD